MKIGAKILYLEYESENFELSLKRSDLNLIKSSLIDLLIISSKNGSKVANYFKRFSIPHIIYFDFVVTK